MEGNAACAKQHFYLHPLISAYVNKAGLSEQPFICSQQGTCVSSQEDMTAHEQMAREWEKRCWKRCEHDKFEKLLRKINTLPREMQWSNCLDVSKRPTEPKNSICLWGLRQCFGSGFQNAIHVPLFQRPPTNPAEQCPTSLQSAYKLFKSTWNSIHIPFYFRNVTYFRVKCNIYIHIIDLNC